MRDDPKRVVAEGYDRMGREFDAMELRTPARVTTMVPRRGIGKARRGSAVLEVGCGPGTDAMALSAGRRYVGVDLWPVQLSIARQRAPHATFVVGDVATIAFRPASFDGVVAFYMVNHLPERELAPTFERAFEWLRPGGRLMLSLLTLAAEDRVEEWLVGVPMFFGGYTLHSGERLLRETGFHLEVSEVRAEGVDFGYGPMETHWVIARKPGEDVP